MMTLERPRRSTAPSYPRILNLSAVLTAALGLLAGCGDSGQPAGSASSSSSANAPASAPIPAPDTLPANASPADKAWAAFEQKMRTPPEPPADWATQAPDQAARAAFEKTRGEVAVQVADVAPRFLHPVPHRFPRRIRPVE
jgi:hypothetical protein